MISISSYYITKLLVVDISEMVTDLWSQTRALMLDGIRLNTKRTYKSGQKDYIQFCDMFKLPMLPASQEIMMMYATHLYRRKMHISTIQTYLFAVRHLHIINDCNSPLLDTPRLQLVLKYIQRNCEKSPDKLPITQVLLERMYNVLGSSHDEKLISSAMTLGFFGLLRAAEFTVPSQTSFDPNIHLTFGDVSQRTLYNGAKFMSVKIKQSKTDVKCRGILVHIGCSEHKVCAVCAMATHLEGKTLDYAKPLFQFNNGSVLTRSLLVNHTRTYLALAGIDPERFTGHSFRVGGATSAAEAGLSEWEIKLMGRWSSDCYHRYIKASIIKITSFASRMIKQ